VANLLFGDVSPSGKLPLRWPRTVGHVPFICSHTRSHEPQNQRRRYWDEPSTPLFRFGHGLVRELKGFRRVTLSPQASQQVQFDIGPEHRRPRSARRRVRSRSRPSRPPGAASR
jgi:Glycosyl hydrolase family 3 C-terminal domain/Fibronectin type III-like domain